MADSMISGIDIHTYLVKDADRATAFWRDVMGLKLTWQMPGQGAEFELPDGSYFGLWKMEDGSWNPGSGVLFAVPDVRAAMEAYKAKGVRFLEHVEETPACTMAFGEDSEGNFFILHTRKGA